MEKRPLISDKDSQSELSTALRKAKKTHFQPKSKSDLKLIKAKSGGLYCSNSQPDIDKYLDVGLPNDTNSVSDSDNQEFNAFGSRAQESVSSRSNAVLPFRLVGTISLDQYSFMKE